MKLKLKKPGVKNKEGLKISGIYGAIFTLLGSSFFPDIPDETQYKIMIFVMDSAKEFSKLSPGEIIDWIMKIAAALMIGYSQLLHKDSDDEPNTGDAIDGKSIQSR